MAFIYNQLTSANSLVLKNDELAHLKAMRYHINDSVYMRNLQDNILYEYKITIFDRNSASLELINTQYQKRVPSKVINILWCAVEPKILEKTLSPLNELGVSSLSIITCTRSQGSWRYDDGRIKRILISSCEQSGRSEPMQVKFVKCLPQEPFYMIDFCGKPMPSRIEEGSYLIGPEGGFSESEREILLPKATDVYKFNEQFTLRSETAAISVAAKCLL
jgi:16S rRNA (uracil1498-N3)-methyltransferase